MELRDVKCGRETRSRLLISRLEVSSGWIENLLELGMIIGLPRRSAVMFDTVSINL